MCLLTNSIFQHEVCLALCRLGPKPLTVDRHGVAPHATISLAQALGSTAGNSRYHGKGIVRLYFFSFQTAITLLASNQKIDRIIWVAFWQIHTTIFIQAKLMDLRFYPYYLTYQIFRIIMRYIDFDKDLSLPVKQLFWEIC